MMTVLQQEGVSLSGLLQPWLTVAAMDERLIADISSDSRAVGVGCLFLAWPGQLVHGGEYISQAIDNGAVAIVLAVADPDAAEAYLSSDTPIPVIVVNSAGMALGDIAARFYDYPSSKLKLIGITGTNGKTSCSHYLAQLTFASSAVIGTLGNGMLNSLNDTENTTPGGVELQTLLASFVEQGIETVAMEVSSHAIDQQRISGCQFSCAMFTNLTQDHLDYHGDMASYVATKKRLFTDQKSGSVIINLNDKYGQEFLQAKARGVNSIAYGIDINTHQSDMYLSASQVTAVAKGVEFYLDSSWGSADICLPLYGDFNVLNILAVMAALLDQDVPFSDLVSRVRNVRAVAGRMEVFPHKRGADVIVDFAHTPDALKQALQTVRKHYDGKLICIFGCGGDRDKKKRPLMGAIAEQFSDLVVLTDDNPRHELPEQIIADIQAGMKQPENALVQQGRATSIAVCLRKSEPGDVILVAGKGHENYQQYGDNRKYFSDRETVLQLLEASR